MNRNEKTLLPPCSIEVDRTTWSLPNLVAHRGAGFLAPENTLAAFTTAKEFSCRAVEFDVQLTADGELVLSHDAKLGRVIDGVGFVGELSAADLKLLRVRNPRPAEYEICFCALPPSRCFRLTESVKKAIILQVKNIHVFSVDLFRGCLRAFRKID